VKICDFGFTEHFKAARQVKMKGTGSFYWQFLTIETIFPSSLLCTWNMAGNCLLLCFRCVFVWFNPLGSLHRRHSLQRIRRSRAFLRSALLSPSNLSFSVLGYYWRWSSSWDPSTDPFPLQRPDGAVLGPKHGAEADHGQGKTRTGGIDRGRRH
jgi:hypothetical protein